MYGAKVKTVTFISVQLSVQQRQTLLQVQIIGNKTPTFLWLISAEVLSK